jgi:hypothetical protein
MSEEVEESDGVMYSADEARWNWSRLLQEQPTLLTPFPWCGGEILTSCGGLLGSAAVKSQCRLMKMGMSEKARNRCALI